VNVTSFRIGQLAAKASMSVQAIRFYERRGLLKAARLGNGYRVYSIEHLLRLAAIQRWRSLGFSLAEIRPLLDLNPGNQGNARLRARMLGKLEEIRQKVGHLRLVEGRLLAWLNGAKQIKGVSHGKRSTRN
jgi:DNA-binding transcriptional MerR regulator